MKLIKASSGKKSIKISQTDWVTIGKKAGWLKTAYRDRLELGPNPSDESTIQIGEDNYRQRAIEEGRRYIELIRKKLGPEPEGARLKITSNSHDFGTYYEVVCEYDDEFPEAINYAYACDSDGPKTWDDTTPVTITPIDTEDYEEDDFGTPETPRARTESDLPPSLPGWD